MRIPVALLVALALSLSAADARADTDEREFFLRGPLSDRPEAGYRWASGWSVSGRAGYRYDELAFGDSSALDVKAILGKRNFFEAENDWRTFWDIDLGVGFVDLDGERLNSLELGAYLGAQVTLTTRLKLAGRVGAVYTRTERSTWATRNEGELARANLELSYSW